MNDKNSLPTTTEEFNQILSRSFISYSMSVIVGRAIADVRDGLKPVQRRILFAMHQSGEQSFSKSARIVGTVMGNYHPHGDSAIYQALVRMAQDFSLRVPMIEKQGNFGSIDGDVAGAPRYTEAKLASLAHKMLEDIKYVDYQKNYDSKCMEPMVLPAMFPHVLLNGTEGIAVGLSNKIPPHNLKDLTNTVLAYLDGVDLSKGKILDYLKGPDFPMGGVVDRDSLTEIYATGKGIFKIYPKIEISDNEVIITSMPYGVTKLRLIKDISDKVHENQIVGIDDIIDDSQGNDINIRIIIKKHFEPKIVAHQVLHMTIAKSSFGCHMLLVKGSEIKMYPPHKIIEEFVVFRRETLRRKYKDRLIQIEKQLHKLFGIYVILDSGIMQSIVASLMQANTMEEAKTMLGSYKFDISGLKKWAYPESIVRQSYALSIDQIDNILNSKITHLTKYEKEKIKALIEDLKIEASSIQEVLNQTKLIDNIIREDMIQIGNKFASERKTEITSVAEVYGDLDVIHDEPVNILITSFSRITISSSIDRMLQTKGGKGKNIFKNSFMEGEFIKFSTTANLKDRIMLFTNSGRMFKLYVYEIGKCDPINLSSIINLQKDYVTSILCFNENEITDEDYILMFTKLGLVKRNSIKKQYDRVSKAGKIAIRLREDDALVKSVIIKDSDNACLFTRMGRCLPLDANTIRQTSRNSSGVKSIKLDSKDLVVDALAFKADSHLIMATTKGYGKSVKASELKLRSRNTKGILCLPTKRIDKIGTFASCIAVGEEEEPNDVGIFTTEGRVIFISPDQIKTIKRTGMGTKLVSLGKGLVTGLSTIHSKVD